MRRNNIPILISVMALCISCYAAFVCDKRIEADWMGVLVGVLSLLVTAVIGINIYTLVDFKRATKEVELLKAKLHNDVNTSIALSSNDTFMIYHYLITGVAPLGLEYGLIQSALGSLIHLSSIGQYKTCGVVASALGQCIPNPKTVVVPRKSKEELILMLSEVSRPRMIEGFPNVAQIVASLGVRD